MKRFGIITFATILVILGLQVPASAADLPTVMLTEVKVKNTSAAMTDEFIELYNPAAEAVDLGTLSLVYFNVYNPGADTVPTQTTPLPEGMLEPGASLVLAIHPDQVTGSQQLALGSLKDAEGQLRLMLTDPLTPAAQLTLDQVAWKESSVMALPDVVPVPSSGAQSIQKFAQPAGETLAFQLGWHAAVASPGQILPPPPEPPTPAVSPADVPVLPTGTCDGVALSEILPNPASTDTNNEFIEIFNPTAVAVSLNGCSLAVGSKVFPLPDNLIQPGQYVAFYDSQTKLTLPNAAGGTVTLITISSEQAVQYPADMKDDQSLALIGGTWQITSQPTPGATNQFATVESATTAADEELTPCPAGKYRNPATNRCKTIDSDDALTPCKVGQYRNPETNRCNSVVTASSALTPCRPGQERNPDTNRCRSVESASASLTPCSPGEERNPDTNRCRKVPTTATTASATTSPKPTTNKLNYLIIGTVLAAVLGYGAYEYRHDIRNKYLAIKAKASGNTNS